MCTEVNIHFKNISMLPITLLLVNTSLVFGDVTKHNRSLFDATDLFSDFNSYEKINEYLTFLQDKYPEKVTLEHVGTSNNNDSILCIKISLRKSDNETMQKPIILIDSGTHAREWMAPAVASYLINQLVEYEENEYLLYNVNWYIIPLLNPDGYIYSMSSKSRRYWRKNRAQGIKCHGVDINRNFDYKWGTSANKNECIETYQGPKPFSEPETRAIKNFALKYQKCIKLYVSLHTWGEKLIYPWAYVNKSVSDEFEKEHMRLGWDVINAINSVKGSNYRAGRHSDIFYTAAGVSVDWMSAVAKIPLCYILEMNNQIAGFRPPKPLILPTGKEIFKGFEVFHKYVEKKWKPDIEEEDSINNSDKESVTDRINLSNRNKIKRKH